MTSRFLLRDICVGKATVLLFLPWANILLFFNGLDKTLFFFNEVVLATRAGFLLICFFILLPPGMKLPLPKIPDDSQSYSYNRNIKGLQAGRPSGQQDHLGSPKTVATG